MLHLQWGCSNISSFALHTQHIHRNSHPQKHQTSAQRVLILSQWENISTQDATLKNFTTQHRSASSLGPLVSQKLEEMKNEPWAMRSTGATHIFKCAFQNQKHKFLSSKTAYQNATPRKSKQNIAGQRTQIITPTNSPYSISSPEIFNTSELSYYTVNTVN